MLYSSAILAAAALTGLASAQNYSTSGNISVVPSSVPYAMRQSWCRGQTNTCPLICGGFASPNTCDPDDLTYVCTCTNGMSPNISAYIETLPFYVCQQWRIDCTAANPNNAEGQAACQSLVCGTLNATDDSTSSSASSSSSAAGSAATSSSSSGSASSSSAATTTSASSTASSSAAAASSSSGAMAMSVGQQYGTGILAAGILAFFGLAL